MKDFGTEIFQKFDILAIKLEISHGARPQRTVIRIRERPTEAIFPLLRS
jgi:hypothetical protein